VSRKLLKMLPSGFQTPEHDRTEEDSSQPAENVSAAGDSPSTEDASVISASTVLPPTGSFSSVPLVSNTDSLPTVGNGARPGSVVRPRGASNSHPVVSGARPSGPPSQSASKVRTNAAFSSKQMHDHGQNLLKTFADSNYAGDQTRRSTYGIVTMLNGGPVMWTSTLGKTVATSTCEAEVNAAVAAVKEAIHLKRLLVDLRVAEDFSIKVMEDNSACISQANSGLRHVRNAKHYEVKLRFLQQRVVDKEVEFEYCPTNRQLADFFTKPLDEVKFLGFRNLLMT